MYRDDDSAALARIASLEERLAEQTSEVARLGSLLERHESEVERRLRARTHDDRTRARRWRLLAVLASAGLVVVLIAAELRLREVERTERERAIAERAPSAPLLADPPSELRDVTPGPERPRLVASEPSRLVANDPWPECDERDPLCRSEPPESFDPTVQKRNLRDRALRGVARETELRMLKAICMNDGDRPCRDMAVARLKALDERMERERGHAAGAR